MNWAKITKGAWEQEIAKGNFDVTGTLKFQNGRKIDRAKAEALLAAYWHRIDRIFFGRYAADDGMGVDRWCFIEFGECGENLHLHFVAKSPCDPILFCCVANAIWSGFNPDTAPLAKNWITPIQDQARTAAYITKETRHLRYDMAGLMCAHRNPGNYQYDNQGNSGQQTRILNRLTIEALEKAHHALEKQIELTQASISRHNGQSSSADV